VVGYPDGPLIKPQWIVWFFTWNEFSLSARVGCPPNRGLYKSFSDVFSSWSM
jgi:hypothetical protein